MAKSKSVNIANSNINLKMHIIINNLPIYFGPMEFNKLFPHPDLIQRKKLK